MLSDALISGGKEHIDGVASVAGIVCLSNCFTVLILLMCLRYELFRFFPITCFTTFRKEDFLLVYQFQDNYRNSQSIMEKQGF
jgi:hypothetical protein